MFYFRMPSCESVITIAHTAISNQMNLMKKLKRLLFAQMAKRKRNRTTEATQNAVKNIPDPFLT